MSPESSSPTEGDTAIAGRLGPLEHDVVVSVLRVGLDGADGCELPELLPIAAWTQEGTTPDRPPPASEAFATWSSRELGGGYVLAAAAVEDDLAGRAGENVFVSMTWTAGTLCGVKTHGDQDDPQRAFRFLNGQWEDLSNHERLVFEAEVCER